MRRVSLIFSVGVSVAIYSSVILMTDVQVDLLAPLGAIWCTFFDCSQLPTHTLVTYRDQLDFMPSDQEVDDMASVVIQEPTSSPSQMAIFAKKVQTIIRRCIVSIGGTLGCTPSQHDIQQIFPVQPSCRCPREPVPDRGARGVKRGARGLHGGGARGGRPPAPLDLCRRHADPGRGGEMGEGSGGRGLGDLGSSYQVESLDSPDLYMPSFSLGLTQPTQSHPPTSYVPPPPGLAFSSFQSPHPPGNGSSSFQAPLAQQIVSSSFQAPPPPYTVGSSTQHMLISIASSSD
ncbi:hypothetical protein M9H77_28357 [Catharanthus roseus]|uniref:Uncharacterized protein n=1 Tax=Catharanthus roseus TaxID=4058 RepID=A0ACC0AHD7_CATRO|nr:hypothetical protein M9H77_28357 [Catharanthus roseus]